MEITRSSIFNHGALQSLDGFMTSSHATQPDAPAQDRAANTGAAVPADGTPVTRSSLLPPDSALPASIALQLKREGLDGAGQVQAGLGGGTPPVPIPAADTDPSAVATWWAGLSAQEQQLAGQDYARLGQLRGLPATVLDTANRKRLDDDIAATQQKLADTSLSETDRKTLQKRLDDDNGVKNAASAGQASAQVFLLAYSPDGTLGQTGAEISFGNPDTATDTAVVVPGTGAKVTSDFTRDGLTLYNKMGSDSKAVVVWLDGAEPNWVGDAVFDKWAEKDTANMAADLNGLRAAHQAASGNGGHLTAIGFSYGSYILGRALNHGANVDDAVFIGSPGVGVDHASDLSGVPAGHVWNGQAGDDPILLAKNRFTPRLSGNNPSDSDFGAQNFSVADSHGHFQYYKDGSESLTNIADIASGNYDAVHRVAAPDSHGPLDLLEDAFSAYLDPLKDTVNSLVHDGNAIGAAAGDVLNTVTDAARDVLHAAENAGSNAVNAIADAAKDALHTAENIGNAINKMMPWKW